MRSTSQTRISVFLQRFGLVVMSVVCFATFAECTSRAGGTFVGIPFLSNDKNGALYMPHPYLHRVPRPNARFQSYTVNSHGYRGKPFRIPKPRGVTRILVLGGSAVWDEAVSADDKTWPAQLERELNRRSGDVATTFEVINGGVPGYNSAESFMNFVWRGIHTQPDVVLVYHGYNDYKPNRHPGFSPDYAHWRQRDHAVVQSLTQQSRLLFFLSGLAGILRPRANEAYDTVDDAGLTAFADNLGNLAVLARARGVEPFFATYAMSVSERNFERHPERFHSMLHRYLTSLSPAGVIDAHTRYNEAVQRAGRSHGVTVIDLAAHVPKDFQHFQDHCHFTDDGAAAAARYVAPILLDRLQREDGAPEARRPWSPVTAHRHVVGSGTREERR